ncbi:hypothetical protein [Adlercreutzia sp. ZJ242]
MPRQSHGRMSVVCRATRGTCRSCSP